MNILRPSIYAIAVTSLALSGANAQTTATTDPVGFTTLTVRGKANAGAANRNNFASLNMQRPPAFQGTVTSASVVDGRSVLTVSGASFTPDQFNGTGNAHYVRLISGANAGQISEVIATTATTITVADNLSDVITPGSTSFMVTPYWTLSTAFPSGAGLTGSTSATAADTITIIPPTGASLTYFYNTTANQWRRGTTDSSNVVIPPGSGMQIVRKQVGDVNIVLAGNVSLGPIEGIVGAAGATTSRNSFLANPFPLASKTLAQSGLYTGNATTGVVGGTSATAADTVTIFDPSTGVANSYFYNTSANQWRRGTTDSSNIVIPEGAAVQITRKANRGEFSWFIPQPEIAL